MQVLTRAIFSQLTADTYTVGGFSGSNTFKTNMGSRIFLLTAPSSSALPLATFTMSDPATDHFFGGKRKQTASFVVSIFHKAEAGADVMLGYEQNLFSLLDRQSLTVANHDRGFVRNLTRGTPELDGEFIRIDSTFEIQAFSS